MTERMKLGESGESFACEYLKKKGYDIIKRNYRESYGELDIVAKAPDKTLVFVEVKTMRDGGEFGLAPEDQMSGAKMKKFRRVAELYANTHEDLVHQKSGWRLDAITLVMRGEKFEICHYENV